MRRVMKTVPRRRRSDPGLAPSQQSAWLMAGLTLATCSFCACALALHRAMQQEQLRQAELHGLLASKVPDALFGMPVVAFGSVMMLNILNLPSSRPSTTRWRSNLCLCFVNAVALVTDTLIYLRLTPVALAGNGRLIHPLRYIQWTHSTPTMIYMMSITSDLQAGEVWFAMANDVSMILTGLASTMSGPVKHRFVWGAASFLNFAIVLLYLTKAVRSAAREAGDQHSRSSLRAMLVLTLVLWSAYPAAWLAAELGALTPSTEQLVWAVLDYFAKAVFTSQMWQANIKSVEERREAALQAWENSNRVMVVDKLRHLIAAKDTVLHTMSHELRTPLLGMLAMTSSLLHNVRKGQADQKEQVRQLSMVRSCTSCLLNIVTTTLDAATGQEGAQVPDNAHGSGSPKASRLSNAASTGSQSTRRPLRLRPLVEDVAALIRPLVNEGVVLCNEVPPDLPCVAADVKRLTQVFFNLIGNAARFTHSGSIRVTACLASDSAVQVTVEDSGIGIARENIAAIFDTHVQEDVDVAAVGHGMGLGLYLVKLALVALGSHISVESELGKGTTFTFNLPVAEGDEAEGEGLDGSWSNG